MAQPLCLFLIQVVGLGFGPELVLGLDFLINFYSDLGAGGGSCWRLFSIRFRFRSMNREHSRCLCVYSAVGFRKHCASRGPVALAPVSGFGASLLIARVIPLQFWPSPSATPVKKQAPCQPPARPPPSPWLAIELDHLCGVEKLNSAQGELWYHVMCFW